jgi:hypothetical protein
MKEQGVGVASLAAPIGYQTISDGAAFTEQLEQLRHVCDLADTLGCRWIRVGTFCPDGSLGHQDASLQVFDCLPKWLNLPDQRHARVGRPPSWSFRLTSDVASAWGLFRFTTSKSPSASPSSCKLVFKPFVAYKQLAALSHVSKSLITRSEPSIAFACPATGGWRSVKLACSNGF